ncbi:Site-specific recombinase XerD [Mucilaginibacter gossypiicola]|uniref:Site-specific recombinase XerD n=1 Tax=Mucilaginibacter gossypiicola TaxID=551995 RepID=A0A1H8HM69_9SPHI|nr:site-specific integrase [Mucilaginibacter gossypiicola]SEN57204.1 Site-specific recombinase XerD [Mucilaginibacter gossypiicola]
MKSNQKLAILFWIRKSKANKYGMAPIYARVTINGEEENISISKNALPDTWNVKEKKVAASVPDAKAINLKIALVENDLNRHFILLQSQYDVVTPIMLKNSYLGKAVNDKGSDSKANQSNRINTLLGAFSEFITHFELMVKIKMRSHETLKHWRTTKSKVSEFINLKLGLTDLDLTDLRASFAPQFYKFLTLEVEEPLSEITAKMHVKKSKQIAEYCVTNEWMDKNPLKGFKCGGGEKEVLPLEMADVYAIHQKQIDVERLAEVRDAFIFQCFTGYAFQDIYGLTPENIILVGSNGERWLSKERGKTGVSEMVPILPIVEDLITKYANHPYCIKNNCIIPINSNAKYNAYLKELAVICGVNQKLNTHLARHTFADMMLNNGVPLEDVSKMLGHKSIRTTIRYCRVKKFRISTNVAKVKSILFTETGQLKQVS